MSEIEIKGKEENKNENGEIERDRSQTSESLLVIAQQNEVTTDLLNKKIESVIEERLLKDRSPEAKAGRRRMLIRAVYGEFMCSLIFYSSVFCVLANGYVNNYASETISLTSAFVAGFQAISVSFAFSSVSGAQFNSAISFALWLTGKLSNRRAILYVIVQLFASIMSMVVVACIFNGDLTPIYNDLVLVPSDTSDLGRVFATEFFLTFFLTYVAFTVAFEDAESQKKDTMSFKTISDSKGLTLYASNPQSKTGFAPFSIGLTIFCLALVGGSSGGAFNPGRLLGPAVFSGNFDYIYLYWLGEVVGASCAGLLVNNLHRIGLKSTTRKDEVTAKETVRALGNKSQDTTATKNPLASGHTLN
jgi:glycerol uptake facilitator-like aquaporin